MTTNQVIYAMNNIKAGIGDMAESMKSLEDATSTNSMKPEDHLEHIIKLASAVKKNAEALLANTPRGNYDASKAGAGN